MTSKTGESHELWTLQEAFLLEILALPSFFERHTWEDEALMEIGTFVCESMPHPDQAEAISAVLRGYETLAAFAPKAVRFQEVQQMILEAKRLNANLYEEACCMFDGSAIMANLAEAIPAMMVAGKQEEVAGILEKLESWIQACEASASFSDPASSEFAVWNAIMAGFAEHVRLPTPKLEKKLLSMCGPGLTRFVRSDRSD